MISSAEDLVRSFQFKTGLSLDRMAVLNSIWEKEWGYVSCWKLSGVKKGKILILVSSSAAAQELQARSRQIVASLNKYFQKPWIKGVISNFKQPGEGISG